MATIQMCLPIARIELLDATQIRHVMPILGYHSKKVPRSWWNFINAGVAEQVELFGKIIAGFDGQNFVWDTDENKRKQYI